MAKDEDNKVRQEVAQNIYTPDEVLAGLATDKDKLVRLYIACNSCTPTEVLSSLAEDEDGDIRDRAFRNLSEQVWRSARLRTSTIVDAHR